MHMYLFASVFAVVVVNRNNKNPTVLTCSTEPVNGSITWTHDSAEIEIDHVDYQQNGGNLTLSYVETPEVGKYTCWSGNHELSSTYLLLEVQREKDSGEMLHSWFVLIFLLIEEPTTNTFNGSSYGTSTILEALSIFKNVFFVVHRPLTPSYTS